MKLVRPMNKKKQAELENELNLQKKRFMEATHRSADKIHEDLSLKNLISENPFRSVGTLFILGFFATYQISKKAPHSKD